MNGYLQLFSQQRYVTVYLILWWGARSCGRKCPPARSRRWPSALAERAHPSLLHLQSYILPLTYLHTHSHLDDIIIDYAIKVCWTQAGKLPPGWPRFCQYLPGMLCSWYKPVDWPVLSAHQVGVTNVQRLHASRPCHSIETTCTAHVIRQRLHAPADTQYCVRPSAWPFLRLNPDRWPSAKPTRPAVHRPACMRLCRAASPGHPRLLPPLRCCRCHLANRRSTHCATRLRRLYAGPLR